MLLHYTVFTSRLDKNQNPTVAWPSGNLYFSFTRSSCQQWITPNETFQSGLPIGQVTTKIRLPNWKIYPKTVGHDFCWACTLYRIMFLIQLGVGFTLMLTILVASFIQGNERPDHCMIPQQGQPRAQNQSTTGLELELPMCDTLHPHLNTNTNAQYHKGNLCHCVVVHCSHKARGYHKSYFLPQDFTPTPNNPHLLSIYSNPYEL